MMLNNVAANTNVLFYLMVAVGVLGVLAKIVNQIILSQMTKAAREISRTNQKLLKLIRSKHEHACMIHDKVENPKVFVEKYFCEYRPFLFRIHTWQRLEGQTVWFTAILAVLGAMFHFIEHGFCEAIYQYLAYGGAQMLGLVMVSRLSDEEYQLKVIKNYAIDYIENTCARRNKNARQLEGIDVIQSGVSKAIPAEKQQEPELSINIEGKPRKAEKGENFGQASVKVEKVQRDIQEENRLREETIRHILEEFLA